IVLDVRRGEGPNGAFDYTLPVVATTERLIRDAPATAAAAVRAVVASHAALRNDVSLAANVGRKLPATGGRTDHWTGRARSAVLRRVALPAFDRLAQSIRP